MNDPWVLLVSSILLLPVKLLPSVLPQEIKTQRETSVLEEEQEDRGFPLQPVDVIGADFAHAPRVTLGRRRLLFCLFERRVGVSVLTQPVPVFLC